MTFVDKLLKTRVTSPVTYHEFFNVYSFFENFIQYFDRCLSPASSPPTYFFTSLPILLHVLSLKANKQTITTKKNNNSKNHGIQSVLADN